MRLAVLASGSGTILEAMCAAGISVDLVVVDRPCRAVDVARSNAITAVDLNRIEWQAGFDRDAFTCRTTEVLQEHEIELVAMAGFGTVLAGSIYESFGGRILNTHPSLLPSFPGWHAVDAALAAGVKVTGCTVHVATLEVDSGPILAQAAVAVLPEDSAASLHERIKVVERRLYIDTIKSVIETGLISSTQERQAP